MLKVDCWALANKKFVKRNVLELKANADIDVFAPGGRYTNELVVVNGRLYRGSDVNYILQGRLSRWGGQNESTALAITSAWKHKEYGCGASAGVSDWTQAGHRLWYSNKGMWPRSEYSSDRTITKYPWSLFYAPTADGKMYSLDDMACEEDCPEGWDSETHQKDKQAKEDIARRRRGR